MCVVLLFGYKRVGEGGWEAHIMKNPNFYLVLPLLLPVLE
jgi:hypothetical protein